MLSECLAIGLNLSCDTRHCRSYRVYWTHISNGQKLLAVRCGENSLPSESVPAIRAVVCSGVLGRNQVGAGCRWGEWRKSSRTNSSSKPRCADAIRVVGVHAQASKHHRFMSNQVQSDSSSRLKRVSIRPSTIRLNQPYQSRKSPSRTRNKMAQWQPQRAKVSLRNPLTTQQCLYLS